MLLNPKVMLLAVVALTVVFVCLFFYFRAGAVERARAEWKTTQPPLPEERFVQNALGDTVPGLLRRLAIWVYAVPLVAIMVLSYILNLPEGG